MAELSLRQLQARLEDLEEQHSKDVAELRELRREGAPAAKIEAAEEKVERTEEKAKTAEEEIADAKATLRRHGFELDEDETVPAGQGEPEEAPEADALTSEAPVQEPPKANDPPKPATPKPDVEPESAQHWYERTV